VHGPVPQASPPQPQVSHSITSDGTPSVARSAASLLQPHSERGVEPNRSGRSAALPGCQGVRPTLERCFLAARAGCGAATNSRHAFWDIFDAFGPYTRTTCPLICTPVRCRAARGRPRDQTGRGRERFVVVYHPQVTPPMISDLSCGPAPGGPRRRAGGPARRSFYLSLGRRCRGRAAA